MIDGLRVLGLVPARGGSKGLPAKNIAPVGGRPLLAWTADAAHGSRYLDRTVLSTDDEAIAAAGEGCGLEVPFRRPIALASDTAATIDVVVHALDILPGYDLLVLLQPTSPLRTAADIDAVIERLVATGAPSCVSVVSVEQSPYWMVRIADNWQIGPLLELPVGVTRRQELPPIYALNGAVYVARVDWLRRERRFVGDGTVAVVMPFERSVDIDTTADLERLEQLINKDLNA